MTVTDRLYKSIFWARRNSAQTPLIYSILCVILFALVSSKSDTDLHLLYQFLPIISGMMMCTIMFYFHTLILLSA